VVDGLFADTETGALAIDSPAVGAVVAPTRVDALTVDVFEPAAFEVAGFEVVVTA
jgi:hypothetical protein